jgi:hypothetical protein
MCHVTKVGFAHDGDGDSDFGEEGRVGDLFDTPFVVKIMKDGGFVSAAGDVTDSACDGCPGVDRASSWLTGYPVGLDAVFVMIFLISEDYRDHVGKS